MQSLKTVFGVIGALVPIAYCGGLLYYFLNLSGSVHEAQEIGLGPTVLGLGVVGLLFCIALVVRLVWIFAAARSAGSAERVARNASTHDGEAEFDADAVLARYMANRPADAASDSPSAPSAPKGGGPAAPSSFGRRIR